MQMFLIQIFRFVLIIQEVRFYDKNQKYKEPEGIIGLCRRV